MAGLVFWLSRVGTASELRLFPANGTWAIDVTGLDVSEDYINDIIEQTIQRGEIPPPNADGVICSHGQDPFEVRVRTEGERSIRVDWREGSRYRESVERTNRSQSEPVSAVDPNPPAYRSSQDPELITDRRGYAHTTAGLPTPPLTAPVDALPSFTPRGERPTWPVPWPVAAFQRPSTWRWSTGNDRPTAVEGVPTSRWIPPQSTHRVVKFPFLPAEQFGTLYSTRCAMKPMPQRPWTHTSQMPQRYWTYTSQFPTPPQTQWTIRGPIHPDLATPTRMRWPVFLPPGMAQVARWGTGRMRTAPVLEAPATSPPFSGLTITFESPRLMHWQQRWGPILVPVHFRSVTVGDVLYAIYNYVVQPLTAADLAVIVPLERVKMERARVRRQTMGSPFARADPLRADVFDDWVFFGGLIPIRTVGGGGAHVALRLIPGS